MKMMMMMKLMIIFLLVSQTLISSTTSASSPSSSSCSEPIRKHFVLVHGASHGAWCWYKLVGLLRLSGHDVTALDLGASGINPKQHYDVETISDYFKPLMEFMAALAGSSSLPAERVILVGHSFGGLAISQAMEVYPEKIAVAIFVTALMPGPHFNVSTLNKESLRRQGTLLDSRYIYKNGPKNPPTAFEFGSQALSEMVYQQSPIEDLALASMLVRPLYLYSEKEMAKIRLTDGRYGSVNRVFIVSEEDKLSEKDFQEWMIMQNPPQQVHQIKGSDHMVMLSKPIQLFRRLRTIAENYP